MKTDITPRLKLLVNPKYIFTLALSVAIMFWFSDIYWGKQFYMSDWLRHQFFINYIDFGFVKRGLIGTLLYPFPSLLTYQAITYFSFAIAILAIAFFWWYFFSKTNQLPLKSQIVLALCVLTGPGFIMHIGTDIGRFDWVGLLVFIASLIAIEKRYLFLASLINVIGILSHEACFLAFLPTVLAVELFIQYKTKQFNIFSLVKLTALPLISMIAISFFGQPPFASAMEVRNLLLEKNQAFVDIQLRSEWWDDPLNVITRSFAGNFQWAKDIYYGADATYADRRIWIFAGLLWFLGYVLVFIYYLKINELPIPWYSIASISPLSMLAIAIDFPRMISLATITVFLMFIILLDQQPKRKINIPLLPAFYIIATGLCLGPFGDIWLFPSTLTPRFH